MSSFPSSTRAHAEGRTRAELIRRTLATDVAVINSSFGALRGEYVPFDRGDGERGAHLERIAAR